jgi:hypothetical protein
MYAEGENSIAITTAVEMNGSVSDICLERCIVDASTLLRSEPRTHPKPAPVQIDYHPGLSIYAGDVLRTGIPARSPLARVMVAKAVNDRQAQLLIVGVVNFKLGLVTTRCLSYVLAQLKEMMDEIELRPLGVSGWYAFIFC